MSFETILKAKLAAVTASMEEKQASY